MKSSGFRRLVTDKKYRHRRMLDVLAVLVGGFIWAVGLNMFVVVNPIAPNGLTGIAAVINHFTGFPVGMTTILLNVPLFFYGYKKQGKTFTVYAIYTVLIYSLCAWLINDVLPVDTSFASPLAGTDLLLCSIFGGVISGVGSGLAIKFGGAMDGIEVMSIIFAKRIGISVGTFVMIYNVILYVVCGFVAESWILPLYSIVTYFVTNSNIKI